MKIKTLVLIILLSLLIFLLYFHIYVQNPTYNCDMDNELDKIVTNKDTSAFLYIYSHDEKSTKRSKKFIKCKTHWMKSVKIRNSKFFESLIYYDYYDIYKQWKDVKYVVTATYKTVNNLPLLDYKQDLNLIKNMLKIAIKDDYDIVPFIRAKDSLIKYAVRNHGNGFKIAWYGLLQAMGYSYNTIEALEDITPFFRNIFIIKAEVLIKLQNFMNKAINITMNDPYIELLMSADAEYEEGNPKVALNVFGTTYYQLHPFVFERLPSFFIHVNKLKICSIESLSCQYNN